jgi:hypothetical protein
MNVADTLYYLMAAYPLSNSNRARALNTMFCVIGNGMQWHKGQLVHPEFIDGKWVIEDASVTVAQRIARVFDERKKDDEAREQHRREDMEKHGESAKSNDVKKFIADVIAKRKAEREANPEAFAAKDAEAEKIAAEVIAQYEEDEKLEYVVPDNMDERLADTKFDDWYPMCDKYSKLVAFPNDIHPDWLDAIIETAKLIKAQPNRLTTYTTEGIKTENQRLAHMAMVKALTIRNLRARREKKGLA